MSESAGIKWDDDVWIGLEIRSNGGEVCGVPWADETWKATGGGRNKPLTGTITGVGPKPGDGKMGFTATWKWPKDKAGKKVEDPAPYVVRWESMRKYPKMHYIPTAQINKASAKYAAKMKAKKGPGGGGRQPELAVRRRGS